MKVAARPSACAAVTAAPAAGVGKEALPCWRARLIEASKCGQDVSPSDQLAPLPPVPPAAADDPAAWQQLEPAAAETGDNCWIPQAGTVCGARTGGDGA